MSKRPPLTAERRAALEKGRAWCRRVVAHVNELLALLTEQGDLPPLSLPHDINGWLTMRHEVAKLLKGIEAELGRGI